MLLLLAAIVSCRETSTHPPRTIHRSVYFWKSVFKLSAQEKKSIQDLDINTIYLKFFDVEWDARTRAEVPVAQVRIVDTVFLQHKKIIPAVFITNECIQQADSLKVRSFAQKISGLVNAIAAANNLHGIEEIQIDCDWTSVSKNNYFALLSAIRELNPALTVSATIRLHQVKYLEKTGVPPVNKGLLMCYNMGNLKNIKTDNSIIEKAELEKYIGKLDRYPLPLDVGLPVFEWNVLLRKGQFAGLIQNFDARQLNSAAFAKSGNRYRVLADTTLDGYSFKKEDVLRNETSGYEVVLASGKMLAGRLKAGAINVSLYHLDSLTLSKYTSYELENIYNSLR
ncbi:hypothetical protein EGI32_12310 [Ferruginibacter sp. HRS2-29]|nr:hypothetical protein [Ferruginibacter sp. HRS2-29]